MWLAFEPANQPAFAEAKLQLRAGRPPRVGVAKDSSLADARELGGRFKPAHGERRRFECVNPF
jgi:hypothetical protein